MKAHSIIELLGGVTATARALKISRQAVNRWKVTGIPPLRQYQIKDLTKGILKK